MDPAEVLAAGSGFVPQSPSFLKITESELPPQIRPVDGTGVPAPKPPSPPDTRPDTQPHNSAAPAAGGLTKLERETCLYMLNVLSKYKEAEPFRQPVDWEALNIPDYPVVITTPMDLRTCREKVRSGVYTSMDDWKADVELIWSNCRKYNGEHHPVTKMAEKLQQHFERRIEEARAAAGRELAAQQRSSDAGGPAAGSKGAGRSKSREMLGLGLSAGSDLDDDDDRAALLRMGGRSQQRSPEPQRQAMKRAASGGSLLDAGPSGIAAAGSFGGGKAPPPKRRASGTGLGGAAGGVIPGVDMDALEQLSNTPAARQLGIGDTDDLAFLAVWKRVISRKQQALSEAESLKQNAKKLRRHLTVADERIGELASQLEQERAARQAAEQRVQELQGQYTQLQQQHQQQGQVLDHQKQLLEQQQQVLRQVLQRQQQQQQQQQGQGTVASAASTPAPPAAGPTAPPALAPVHTAAAPPEGTSTQVTAAQPQQQPQQSRESPAPQQQQEQHEQLEQQALDAWQPPLLQRSMSPQLECLEHV